MKALEHQEHAHHAAEHGARGAALIVAVLAAMLAVTEQQAKHAEIKVQANAVFAADAWNQYQGKSTREAVSQDLADMLGSLAPPADPALARHFAAIQKHLLDDARRFKDDPKDGKEVVATRAHEFERERDELLERSHTFDNAAAAFELGIVLATASAITASRMLVRFAIVMGGLGAIFAVLAVVDSSVAAF